MKKLIDFIKSKETENNISNVEKKAIPKSKKTKPSSSPTAGQQEPNDLFWDGYSDIGYC